MFWRAHRPILTTKNYVSPLSTNIVAYKKIKSGTIQAHINSVAYNSLILFCNIKSNICMMSF